MKPKISNLDHFVLTVKDIDGTLDFYSKILGMEIVTFGDNRKALKFGNQKINLLEKGSDVRPRAFHPTIGSADMCFILETPLKEFEDHLLENDIPLLEGPVDRNGATGKLLSLYFMDPENNLIEVANLA